MKTHRFMALLCAGIMALNSAGGQVIHSYAAEAREIVQEQEESAVPSEMEASDFIEEASDPAAGEEIGVADPEAAPGAEEAPGTDGAEAGRGDQTSAGREGQTSAGWGNQTSDSWEDHTSAGQDEEVSDEGPTQETAAASDEGTETGGATKEASEEVSEKAAEEAAEGGSAAEGDSAADEAQTAVRTDEEANGNSELVEEEAGISDLNEKVASLLPLEEKTAALILPGLTETELKKVKVSRIVDYLQDKDGNYYNFTRTDRFI